MRLLIVDDQASARRVLSAIVAKLEGVEIEEADGLASARQVLETRAPDVALIDLRLGPDARNRDGLVLVEEIRARTSVVPIIVTGYQEGAGIRKAMRAGASGWPPGWGCCARRSAARRCPIGPCSSPVPPVRARSWWSRRCTRSV